MSNNTFHVKEKGNSFNEFINEYVHQAVAEEKKDYYPEQVIYEAYKKGMEKGMDSAIEKYKKEVINKHLNVLIQIYESTKDIMSFLSSKNYQVDELFILVGLKYPKSLIVVKEEFLLNDNFIDLAYAKIGEHVKEFYNKNYTFLDISLVGDENLDRGLIQADGFNYSEPNEIK